MQNFFELPKDLPAPIDDGACDHLPGMALPSLALPSTGHREINPAQIPDWLVIYCYPMTGRPGVALPAGWDQIPGARGCTPQSCSCSSSSRMSCSTTSIAGQAIVLKVSSRLSLQLASR